MVNFLQHRKPAPLLRMRGRCGEKARLEMFVKEMQVRYQRRHGRDGWS